MQTDPPSGGEDYRELEMPSEPRVVQGQAGFPIVEGLCRCHRSVDGNDDVDDEVNVSFDEFSAETICDETATDDEVWHHFTTCTDYRVHRSV